MHRGEIILELVMPVEPSKSTVALAGITNFLTVGFVLPLLVHSQLVKTSVELLLRPLAKIQIQSPAGSIPHPKDKGLDPIISIMVIRL